GLTALGAEVFAARIGSPLDAALSLFRLGSDGSLVFVASNGGSDDPARATDGSQPLVTDPLITVALPPGDYYLAVSSGFNYVDPDATLFPGDPTTGVFIPGQSHSGTAGNSTGQYVLNVRAEVSTRAPRVLSTSPAEGETLTASPAGLTVQFDSP